MSQSESIKRLSSKKSTNFINENEKEESLPKNNATTSGAEIEKSQTLVTDSSKPILKHKSGGSEMLQTHFEKESEVRASLAGSKRGSSIKKSSEGVISQLEDIKDAIEKRPARSRSVRISLKPSIASIPSIISEGSVVLIGEEEEEEEEEEEASTEKEAMLEEESALEEQAAFAEEQSEIFVDDMYLYMEEEEAEEEEMVEEEEEPFVSIFDRLDAPRELLSPRKITADLLKFISVKLGQIRLCWPKVTQEPNIAFLVNVILPDGFLVNTNKEKLTLLYCENFRQQYHIKYPNRKPLFLTADNVVKQRKMVCTTLRPTTLTHPSLSTWQELASFVADHVIYESLEPPTILPIRMLSPQIVFHKKKGHSIEMSSVLCSLLLGRNYNAYVIYGFAAKEVTERDTSHLDFPFDEEKKKVDAVADTGPVSKYALKPPRDLRSKFLLAQEQKEIDKRRRDEEEEEELRKMRQIELEKPPPDPLYGQRIHSWILMLPKDEKDDSKPFFIETSTGMRKELNFPGYISIQSVWNNVNYWVNVQDDSIGVGNLDYNLKDLSKWEHLLPGEPLQERIHPKNVDMDEDEDPERRIIMDEKHLDMPEPWSLRINVPHNELAARFPTGTQTSMYKRTKVERYCPYLLEDGLVMRIYRYFDLKCTQLITIEERYENRSDKLVKRVQDIKTDLIMEYFDRGREDNAKEHTYYKYDNLLESWRKIEFYYQSRFDCLQEIDHGPLYLTENYIGREDRFYYRHVIYAKRGDPPPGFLEGPRRIIKNVVEKFVRNPTKKASDDIAVREFDFISRQMNLKFHYDTAKITASTRTFIKPPETELIDGVSFRPELTYGYQAEIGAKPIKNSTLYSLLEGQMKDEEECSLKINHVEDSIAEFLRVRILENLHPILEVGPFNREQNMGNRQAMLEKEKLERTKKEREIEEELDYICPYLIRLDCAPKLRLSQAIKVYNLCLKDFKDMLVNRANDLQRQFQQKTQTLKNKQIWYNDNLESMTLEEEQEHFKEMNNGNFVLHCLEIRLKRQKELVPFKFENFVQYLEMHPKLEALHKLREQGVIESLK